MHRSRIALAGLILFVSSCNETGPNPVVPCPERATVAAAVPAARRVVVVVLENADAREALPQPFFARLAAQGAYVSNSRGVARPSQPNYFALVSGDTFGVESNENVILVKRHLGDLLEASGKSWKNYAEDFPGKCFLGADSGFYSRKHVPFLSYAGVQVDPASCARVVPATEFARDLEAGTLPDFSLFIPNNHNNGHDTDAKTASAYMERTFGPLIDDPDHMRDTLFIVTYDEPGADGKSPIYTAFAGAGVKAGAQSDVCYDHYNVLRTIEQALGVGTLGRKDQESGPVSGIWATSPAT